MFPQFQRVYEITGCSSQGELATMLGISQASVSTAQHRRNVPSSWLVVLLHKRNINPIWILTGTGPQFVDWRKTGYAACGPEETETVLRQFSDEVLLGEIARRRENPLC